MNGEVYWLLVLSAVCAFAGVIYYFSPFFTKRLLGENDPFENKVFQGNLPFWQLMLISVAMPVLSLIIVFILTEIRNRPEFLQFPVGDKVSLWLLLFFASLLGYGLGTHGTSVSISHYMSKLVKTKAYRTAEFYHHLFSHFIVIMTIVGLAMILSLHEMNHPLLTSMSVFETVSLSIGALIVGIGLGFIVIEGKGKYYSIPTLSISAVVLWFMPYELNISLLKLPALLYSLVMFSSALITMLTWRLKNGELRETIGEFFHLED